MSAAVERAARRAVADAVDRLAARLREVPGIEVEAEAEAEAGSVVVRGRGLARRALVEPALRRPAELVR